MGAIPEARAALIEVVKLARRIDTLLSELNCEYANRRETGRLTPLRVLKIPAGTWARFRGKRIQQRGNLEEYKHPCLVGDLNFVNQLLRDG